MATRRDQLHSYQFMTQRVISAFVMRETDPAQSPLRRGVGALFGGMMVAVLVAAGFGIYGILTKVGSDTWKAEGSVIVEKETGASFVFLDGQLRPTLNYASAMLIAGRPNPTVSRVPSNSLASVPRGVTVGIPNAPDSLPGVKKLVGLPWTVCATPGTDSSGSPTSVVSLVVTGTPVGATALSDRGLLVKDAEFGMTYLIWHGRRHLVQQSRTVLPALFGAVTATSASTAWINAVPAGNDIASPPVTNRGTTSPAVPGRKIGDVLITETGSGPQPYLVYDDGLAPITALQQTILGAQFPTQQFKVEVTEATSAPTSTRLTPGTGDARPPESPPELLRPGGGEQFCAVTTSSTLPPVMFVGGTVDGLTTAIPTGSTSSGGVPLADRVLVPSGHAVVVRVNGSGGTYCLVTDLGIRYSVSSAGVLALLGYPTGSAVDVPATLINRIPAGPTLDPATALLPAIPPGGVTTSSGG